MRVEDGKQLEEVVSSMCISRKPDVDGAAAQTGGSDGGPDRTPGSLHGKTSGKTPEKTIEIRPYGSGLDWLFQKRDEVEEPASKRPRTEDSLLKPGKRLQLKERRRRKT